MLGVSVEVRSEGADGRPVGHELDRYGRLGRCDLAVESVVAGEVRYRSCDYEQMRCADEVGVRRGSHATVDAAAAVNGHRRVDAREGGAGGNGPRERLSVAAVE